MTEAGMVETAVHRLLSESTQKSLETMFFAIPDGVSTNPERPHGQLISVSLTFQGTPPGRFGLLVSERLARTLAGNFMGSEDMEELRPDEVGGVMGELANMLCGVALSDLQSQTNFELSTPVAKHIGAEETAPDFSGRGDALGSPFVCRFEFPEGALVQFLAFEAAQ